MLQSKDHLEIEIEGRKGAVKLFIYPQTSNAKLFEDNEQLYGKAKHQLVEGNTYVYEFSDPNGLTSFSDGTVSGCINTSEIYTPAGGACQPGEGTLMQIQIGGPSTNQCVPIRGQKTYMCPNGYTLSGTTCTSVIPATVTQGRIKTKAKKVIRV